MGTPTRSLVTRLVLPFFLISAGTVLILGFLAFRFSSKALTESVFARLESINNDREERLDRWIAVRQAEIRWLAGLPEVVEGGRALAALQEGQPAPGGGWGRARLGKAFVAYRDSMGDVEEIFLLSPVGGRVLVSTDPLHEGEYWTQHRFFHEGLKGQAYQPLYPSPITGRAAITISIPVTGPDGPVAVLGAHLDLDRLSGLILGTSAEGPEGGVATYAVGPFHLVVDPRVVRKVDYPRGLHSEGIDAALRGDRGRGEYRDFAGRPVVGVYRWLQDHNIALLAEMDRAAAFLPATRLGAGISAGGLLLTILLGLTMRAAARRVAGPVLAIDRAARAVRAGDRTARAPVLTDDEVGELAGTFNAMLDETESLNRDLVEREKRYRLLADNITDVVWTADLDLNFTYFSPSVERYLGFTPVEAARAGLGGLVTTESRKRVQELLEAFTQSVRDGSWRAMAGGLRIELEHRRRDGDVRWGETTVSVLLGTDGHPMALLGSTRDITASKAAQEGLLRREAEQRALLNATTDSVLLLGRDGRILAVNARLAETLGLTEAEAAGRSYFDLLPGAVGAERRKRWERLLESGAPAEYLEVGDLQISLVSAFPIPDVDGQARAWAFFVRDITQQKMAEQELARSEERFRRLFESASDGILLVSPQTGVILDCNRAFLKAVGAETSEVQGRPLGALSSIFRRDGEAQGGGEAWFDAAGVTRDGSALSVAGVRRDGVAVHLEVKLNRIELMTGPLIIAIVHDVTERVQSEEESRRFQLKLIQADKMMSLGLMVSSIAHEVNNPNNTIMFNMRRLEKTWIDALPILEARFREDGDFALGGVPYSELRDVLPRLLEGALQSSELIRDIVSNLKDYVRQSAASSRVGPMDLNSAVRRSLVMLESQVRKGVGRLTLSLDEALPPLRGNLQKAIQVCVNLISNALDALQAEDQGVTVITERSPSGNAVLLRVVDEGRGMDAETLRQATEPFFSTKLDQGGTGLGLTITKMLTEELGGGLEIRSTPGKGTEATVTFPLAPPGGAS